MDTTVTALVLTASVLGLAVILRDTELRDLRRAHARQRDRAERLEQAQRVFLGDVGHMLGTPLSAVAGWTDMLRDGMISEDDRDHYLRGMQRELTRVSRKLRQLIYLSRWEMHAPELHFEPFGLAEVLGEVSASLGEEAQQHRSTLRFDGLDPRWLVDGDRGMIREVFHELLENAVRHAGSGAQVSVNIQRTENRLEVRVRDDGSGMMPAAPGVGLTLAKTIVRAHGGGWSVESAPRQGTEIRFSLPLST